jgi:hypothetical protein
MCNVYMYTIERILFIYTQNQAYTHYLYDCPYIHTTDTLLWQYAFLETAEQFLTCLFSPEFVRWTYSFHHACPQLSSTYLPWVAQPWQFAPCCTEGVHYTFCWPTLWEVPSYHRFLSWRLWACLCNRKFSEVTWAVKFSRMGLDGFRTMMW